MLRFAKTILAVSAIAFAAPSAAAVQIFDFVARIDTPDSPYGTGTVFGGSFSYDDALAPTLIYNLTPATGDLYRADGAEYLSPGVSLSFELGGQSFSGGGLAGVFDMIDQGSEDGDRFFVWNNDDPRYFFALYFEAGNATTFLDTRLPAAFPANLWQGPLVDLGDDDDFNELDLIPQGEFAFYDVERQTGFEARVLSITPAGGAVPEPSTWVMLIVGFGAIASMLRRGRRSKGSLAPSA